MLNLAYFVSHPIQYQAPLLRLIAADSQINLQVFFYSDFSLKAYQDKGFGRLIEWDVPLLEGYNYFFLDRTTNIYNELKVGKFDAVWVHGWSRIASIRAILAAEQLNIPILLRGESNNLNQTSNPIKYLTKRIFLQWLYAKVSGFLCIGSLNRQFYQSYAIEKRRLFQMPYAVDNDYFATKAQLFSSKRAQLKQSLGLEEDRAVILFAAKMIEVKRPLDLLEAYCLLSRDGLQEPDPYLLFVGDGHLRPQLEEKAKWESIKFLGFHNQSQMPAIYDLCDIFVLPSGFEPWGLAINEAMNASKAVIVSDQVGCACDLIVQKENGYIYPAGDISALTQALNWGLANYQKAGQISKQKIQTWSYQQDIQGLKQALEYLVNK